MQRARPNATHRPSLLTSPLIPASGADRVRGRTHLTGVAKEQHNPVFCDLRSTRTCDCPCDDFKQEQGLTDVAWPPLSSISAHRFESLFPKSGNPKSFWLGFDDDGRVIQH